MKWMLVSDIHIPYHNKRYLDMWFEVNKWWKPDVIDIVGDLDDACPVSKYSNGTPAEYENAVVSYAPLVQQFFKDLREQNPDAEIHYHTGNHEARYDHYVASKAPALTGLITPELLWKTETHGIDLSYYDAPPVERYAGYFVHHGPYAQKDAGSSVRKVMDEFNVSAIVGHSHAQAMVAHTYELRNEILRGIELGHMVDIKSNGMAYTRLRDWQPGFGIMHVDGDNGYPSLVPIVDNACYVDGKKFSA